MINTWEYRNYNSVWYQLLFVFRHPICFIKEFEDNMYNWPSLENTIREKWMKVYKRLPFQKACRWLGSELIERVSDSKLLDNFGCRTRDANTKYYFATCHFGYIKFEERRYIYKGKACNLFMDFTVAGLIDDESAKAKAEQTKTKVKVLYKGWIFSKKKAEEVLKQVIKKNPKIYKSEYQNYPEAAIPYLVEYPERMLKLLDTGKLPWYEIDNLHLRTIYNGSKDNIEKLWCYIMHLLSCKNDFAAHNELTDIAYTCNWYLFNKARMKDPTVDTYYNSLIKQGKEKQAKKYISLIKKDNKDYKNSSIKDIKEKINTLKEYYLNMPFNYYRI